MSIKILIAEACIVSTEAGPRPVNVGETIDADRDSAYLLARMGRGYYLERGDDPGKGAYTATVEDKVRLKQQAAAIEVTRAESAAAAAIGSPAGMATLVAEQVMRALTAQRPAASK